MKYFEAHNLGQIKEAKVNLGEFTVFIGPQSSGKSILLQMMKLALDGFDIKKTIKQYGLDYNGSPADFLELYMGEGMSKILGPDTQLKADDEPFKVQSVLKARRGRNERMFLIPAQRVITIQNGWPRNFMSFDIKDPYVVKQFSENLRLLMEKGLGAGRETDIFPQTGRMKSQIRDKIDNSIFYNAAVKLDRSTHQKRIMLDTGKSALPYTAWSAGQREFMPLLLGLYWLMPASKIQKREDIDYVVIEEPEMGLHPMAIEALMLTFLELISRGYKVIVSTHSTTILQLCWTVRLMQQMKADPFELFKLFNLKKRTPALKDIFSKNIKESSFNTYYFERKPDGVYVRDISDLDPADEDYGISEWGGLTAFGSKASEIISNIMAAYNEV
jgi:energy-coupling factor transporter ATP-binding protein EcfA2